MTLGESMCAFDLQPEHVETSRNVCCELLENAGASKQIAARRVSAYPAIIVLSNSPQAGVTVAETTAEFGAASASALVNVAMQDGFTEYMGVGVKAHRLTHWFAGDRLWPTGSPARLALIERLNDKFAPLHDPRTGTKVGIGIATGAGVVNPWAEDGSLVALDDYPRMAAYLSAHPALRERFVAKKRLSRGTGPSTS
jgi:hypothetical protein